MKMYKTTATAFCIMSLSLCSCDVQAKGEKTQIVNYFMQNLRGDESMLFMDNLNKTVKAKKIKDYQQLVWDAWTEANRSLDEEKLIDLRTLCAKNHGAWHLPSGLEPSATMPYYFGIKWRALTTQEIQQNYKSGFQGDDSESTDENISKTAPFPLFLYLHGSGPKADEWKYGLMWSQVFDDAPSVYFIPQIPNEGEYYRWYQKSKQYAWEKLLRQAFASGKIDANRFYMLGISEGGYGSQRLASFYADYLAAAGPMAGGEPLINAPVENCANIGFSFLTGALDNGFYRNKLTAYTKQAFDSLQSVYADNADSLFRHRIQLVPGRGHALDYTPTTPWLKNFVRNPYPKTVLWEDYPMDGRHRKGFYNIKVVERPADRTYYQMTIKDNVVKLDIQDVEYITAEKDPVYGIEMKFNRTYKPSAKGRWKIYLNDELVDMSKPVTVIVNGKKTFEDKLRPNLMDMMESCQEYYDPYRIYPASVEVAM